MQQLYLHDIWHLNLSFVSNSISHPIPFYHFIDASQTRRHLNKILSRYRPLVAFKNYALLLPRFGPNQIDKSSPLSIFIKNLYIKKLIGTRSKFFPVFLVLVVISNSRKKGLKLIRLILVLSASSASIGWFASNSFSW